MRGPPTTTLRRFRQNVQDENTPAAQDVPRSTDIAIIGGGLIGLSIGWRLARRGLDVTLFERGSIGQGASLAATGMLAAAAELEPGGETHLALALESQRLWPDFARALENEGGVDIDYRADGVLLVALGREEVDRLRMRYDLQQRAGLETQWLNGPQCRSLEPGLKPSVTAGILCPADHQVDPPRVMAALRQAYLAQGGQLVEHCEAHLELAGGKAVGVATQYGVCPSRIVIAAEGAWTKLAGLDIPVRPLKGQSLALRPASGPAPLSRMVWTEQIHFAPKSDGTLIVGATMEECGFDDSVTAGGVYALLEGARRALPAVEEMPLEAVWSGFRPTSIDDAPILGDTGISGLLVATGHHRNGYLLAPVTAVAIEQCVIDTHITGPAAEFGPSRFAPVGARS
ncbi:MULTISPECIES: glycine oxidase ThiO [unclassified Beijerinckia]|uniref:glycine oxidase ThiO n=1 Tax=unclassified Beijerinckia TaxID=2638183 RepID=UPI000897B8F5|nr:MULTISPECIES: glycine oxidase ThiO [unclassified Beijerinckia]MDH7798106.1 glycine oxidase [Beijerinckia sp. GAS462]SED09302.1 glycine oxidase [Beijerinckia sp. 28-YEA-48]